LIFFIREYRRLKKSALLFAVLLVIASLFLVSCNGSAHVNLPPSKLTERVLASQSAATPTALSGLVVIDGEYDTLGRGEISAGTSPGLMAVSPQKSVLLAFDSATNKVDVVNTAKETVSGTIQLPGSTISMAVPNSTVGYAAVPSAPLNGAPNGAVVEMNLTSPSITATISVPNAQTVVSNPAGTELLVFSNDSNSVTVVYPPALNLVGTPLTVTIPGFDRPVNAVFGSDGVTAYIFNCGAQCGGTQASVEVLDTSTAPPTTKTIVPVDAATIGLIHNQNLWVVGTSPTNNACTGQTTAAKTCGRLDTIDLNTMTVTGRLAVTDGYHDRIDFGAGGQLFIGSYACTNIGNVNNPQGEVRGCLSIYNAVNNTVVIPPDNGDVTGLQGFSIRYAEYVAEGGNLRVYATTSDTLLITDYIETGTIVITGIITDVKSIDSF
jgi:DNA-binding beta-propeller fold protein YncE